MNLCRIYHRWNHWYRFRELKGAEMRRRICLRCGTTETKGVY